MKRFLGAILLIFCNLLVFTQDNQKKADLVVFSFDRPLQLYSFLESVATYITGINSISVVCRASNQEFKTAYAEVEHEFSNVTFLYQNPRERKRDFKPLTMQVIQSGGADYIMFAVDDIIMTDEVDISECIYWLEQTDAHGFYLRLGTHLNYCYARSARQKVPPYEMINLEHSIIAWQFTEGEYDWNYPNTVDMTVYRKEEVVQIFQGLNFRSPNPLEGVWARRQPHRSIGLCYEHAKMVNIPLNIVTQDAHNHNMNSYSAQALLDIFNEGLKIDIRPLYQYVNLSAHMDYDPTFIMR